MNFNYLKKEIIYLVYNIRFLLKKLDIKVLSIESTLDLIIENNFSVIRIGDGEIAVLNGEDISFQKYNIDMTNRLKYVITNSTDNLLICIPDIFGNLDQYTPKSKFFWNSHRNAYLGFYKRTFSKITYGNSFISRPYLIFSNKNNEIMVNRFERIKKIWDMKDILIIEGLTTRSGVGNDLFSNTKSVKRILCPPTNAFEKYDEILEAAKKYGKNKLVLTMLGPTAKILTYDLSIMGIQTIDIGHIDSEYEWFKRGVENRVEIPNKHTAELKTNKKINDVDKNDDYHKQIVAKIIS